MGDIRRREFVTLLSGAAAWPIAAGAQQAERMRRIGVLMGYAETDPAAQAQVGALRQELQKLGWEEGRNIRIDYRYVTADPKLIEAGAAEMITLAPDLIVSNTNLVTTVLQSRVPTVPIVFVSVSDPVGSGFVTELARPAGNLTGFANFEPSMGGKWLETLREIAPRVDRVGLMLHPETPPNVGFLKSAEAAASSLNTKIVGLGVHSGTEIERGLTSFATEPHGGLIVVPHAVTITNSDLIVALAGRFRLPAIYPFALFARAGGLVSYGIDTTGQFRQAASYVDKILRGAKPGNLPVQHPTKFELVVNVKTAKALDLDVPLRFLQFADEVIE